jgi:hypothetical protein
VTRNKNLWDCVFTRLSLNKLRDIAILATIPIRVVICLLEELVFFCSLVYVIEFLNHTRLILCHQRQSILYTNTLIDVIYLQRLESIEKYDRRFIQRSRAVEFSSLFSLPKIPLNHPTMGSGRLADYNVAKANIEFLTRNSFSNPNHETDLDREKLRFILFATVVAGVFPMTPAGRQAIITLCSPIWPKE